jgi:nucleolar GTP-binding protein
MPLIAPVPDEMVKSSIRKAHVRAKAMQDATPRKRELYKVERTGNSLKKKCIRIVKGTASLDRLGAFQKELCGALVDVVAVKKALTSVQWAGNKAEALSKEYRGKMRRTRDLRNVTKLRKGYEARVESIFKRVERDLKTLREAGKRLSKMPSIKELPTAIIAGYPNVGKSTLLRGITGHRVKIASYPFTTQSILVGYMKHKYQEIQVIDTPGLLDRPLEERNPIERQAISALKHLSGNLVYIIDPSEGCGYPVESQAALLQSIVEEFSPNILVIFSKRDVVTKEQLEKAKKMVSPDFILNLENMGDLEKVRERILKWF